MAELSKRVSPKTNPPVPAGCLRLGVFVQKKVRIKFEGPSLSIPGARFSPFSLLLSRPVPIDPPLFQVTPRPLNVNAVNV